MNNYEGVFILKASLDTESQEKLIEEIKSVITKNKGETEQVQSWGKKKLAYLIKKQPEGIYYLVNFKLAPAALKKVENTYKLNDLILRVLLVRK